MLRCQALQQREQASLPEAVAAVHELVGAAVEAALQRALPLDSPAREAGKVERVELPSQRKRSQAAVCVAAMCLVAWLSAKSALVCLAAGQRMAGTQG